MINNHATHERPDVFSSAAAATLATHDETISAAAIVVDDDADDEEEEEEDDDDVSECESAGGECAFPVSDDDSEQDDEETKWPKGHPNDVITVKINRKSVRCQEDRIGEVRGLFLLETFDAE